jgi:SAM-dependent methyltransferase
MTRLAAVRRVDWRFLLPHPELGRVGWLGDLPPSLRAGLEASGAEPVALGHDPVNFSERPHLQPCDCVLSVSPNGFRSPAERSFPVQLRAIPAVLRPGGWLIIEVHGLGGRHGLRRPLAPRAWVRALERQGWEDVRVYWHWPNFEASSQVVPLAEPAALRLALGRGGSGRTGWLTAALGRFGLATGILPRLVPCFSVIARRPEAGGG